MAGWTIALFGTNTNYTIDNKSLVALSTLGVSNPMTDANWLKISVKGVGAKKSACAEPDNRVGNISVQNPAQYQFYDVELEDFVFPDDMPDIDNLNKVLRHKYLFLYKGDYDFTGWSIHAAGYAIAITAVATTEDDYPNGLKSVKLKLRKVNPLIGADDE
jgi:hypothetical protein